MELAKGNTSLQMCAVGNFITYYGFGLYAVAKLRWLVGGFAIADIARVIGCPFIELLILKQTICY